MQMYEVVSKVLPDAEEEAGIKKCFQVQLAVAVRYCEPSECSFGPVKPTKQTLPSSLWSGYLGQPGEVLEQF